MSKKYDYSVFIGRMQPPHRAHIEQIKRALNLAENTIVIFGSHRAARNIKNPWTADEREMMVRMCLSDEENKRTHFRSVRDYYYNDNIWVANVQEAVRDVLFTTGADLKKSYNKIVLIGRVKDQSSYYLELFPQWEKDLLTHGDLLLNATDVRDSYFGEGVIYPSNLYAPVAAYIKSWMNTEAYSKLSEEWKFIQDYKKMWSTAPYPVTFSTVDTVCVKAGHVLMVRRKFNPGKGLLALPGGFVKQNLSLLDSALEELKEETRIKMSKESILPHMKDSHVFDHPNRSLRGRTITHAFYFELPAGGELPQVKGDDDAERALWVPIAELFAKEDEVYEDHIHIVNYFYSNSKSQR